MSSISGAGFPRSGERRQGSVYDCEEDRSEERVERHHWKNQYRGRNHQLPGEDLGIGIENRPPFKENAKEAISKLETGVAWRDKKEGQKVG